MLWVLYALSLLFVWFENKCVVLHRADRPVIFSNQAILWLLRLALTYGTLGGIWFVYGFWTAAIAFGAFYTLNKLTFSHYFSRQIKSTTVRCMKARMEEAAKKHEQIDELQIEVEARELANYIVTSNVKGERS